MNKTNILITGGAGYIGSNVAKELLLNLKNIRIIILDNLETGSLKSINILQKIAKGKNQLIEFMLMDINSIDHIFKQFNIETIFHFAGSLSVEESVLNPTKYFLNNTANTIRLISLAEKHNVKNFIFSSTATVYKTSKEPLKESDLKKPPNPYGLSKLMSEQALEHSKLNFIILRYFNVAGASLSENYKLGSFAKNSTHLIKVAAEFASKKREIIYLFGTDYDTFDGTCIRDYIHIEDLASAHLSSYLYLSNKQESNIFNCGYGKGFSVKEVIKSMSKISNLNIEPIILPRRFGDIDILIADNSKLKNLTYWEPKFDNLDLITSSALDWELLN